MAAAGDRDVAAAIHVECHGPPHTLTVVAVLELVPVPWLAADQAARNVADALHEDTSRALRNGSVRVSQRSGVAGGCRARWRLLFNSCMNKMLSSAGQRRQGFPDRGVPGWVLGGSGVGLNHPYGDCPWPQVLVPGRA